MANAPVLAEGKCYPLYKLEREESIIPARPVARVHALLSALLIAAPLYCQVNLSSPPLTVAEKFKLHMQYAFGPRAFVTSAISAAILQWRNHPAEWGQGWGAYGQRLGSILGQHGIENFFSFTLNAALRQDPRYLISGRGRFSKRLQHALLSTVLQRTDSGRLRFAYPRVASAYGAAFMANTWLPDRIATPDHALARGIVSLAAEAGSSVLTEFLPDARKKICNSRWKSLCALIMKM